MCKKVLCALLLLAHSALSTWDFAVTTKSKIHFYDEHWQEITASAHQFDHLSALTFDEAEEVLYFNDVLHQNGSIFSLRIPNSKGEPHIIEKIVQRTPNESISSIAYDPLNRNLFWADTVNRKILFRSIDAEQEVESKVFLNFTGEGTIPDGVAIDICRRKLYFTNSNFKNATIESVDLDGSERAVLVSADLFLPHGIVVDQLADRVYWVVDQQGIHFSVESVRLDGTDRRVLVQGLNNVPINLAVTKDGVFWTDVTNNAVWNHAKDAGTLDDAEKATLGPHRVISFTERPGGIVARSRFLTTLQNDQHCAGVVKKIRARLLTPRPTVDPAEAQAAIARRDFCLNDGEYSEQSGVCICRIGFKGARCETSECHNFCVHGSCAMSSMGFPKCTCQRGFHGERCQTNKCSGHCFNEGRCKIESSTGEPTCECADNFGGKHCEQNSTEICALFCRVLKYDPETYVPFGCHDICEELSTRSDDYAIPKYQHLEVCKNAVTWNNTLIISLICGVVMCLCLVLLIVHGLRRFYKPARPRIKKTFVVRKRAATSPSDTPLTNRPMATEQCEITIENCCNMNICDTPCFDPKLVQQSLSRDIGAKEDKKMLIHNMEDDLY